MQVLVDTSVWSIALRRKNPGQELLPYIDELTELVNDIRVVMIGAIRQELLSGIASLDQFKKLRSYLASFPDLALGTVDYELAAELFNCCRQQGVQGSHIDFLITAVAINNNLPVFTLDRDFHHYAQHTDLVLYSLNS